MNIRLFADDTTIVVEVDDPEVAAVTLNNDLSNNFSFVLLCQHCFFFHKTTKGGQIVWKLCKMDVKISLYSRDFNYHMSTVSVFKWR